LGSIKLEGNYGTGQMFLHKVFGYRGVVLIPWLANVYDRDISNKIPNTRDRLLDTDNPTLNTPGKEIKGRTHTYYQVLIDGRDTPYITNRSQTESVTFLGNQSENNR
jgi:polymerase delta-interacting protein 2